MPLLATCRVCEACGSDDLRTVYYSGVPLWRKECGACGSCGPFVVDDAHEEGGAMLASEEQAQVAAAAEAIEAAASMVRDLLDLIPGRDAHSPRFEALAHVVIELQQQRRRVLEAWSGWL